MKQKFIILAVISIMIYLGIGIYKLSKPYNEIGKIPVKNLPNVHFELRQENQFDSALALEFRIGTEEGYINDWGFLIGTQGDNLTNDDFYANSLDSVIYLTWGDTLTIYSVYDLKNETGYPNKDNDHLKKYKIADNLFQRLKNKNPQLKASWRK